MTVLPFVDTTARATAAAAASKADALHAELVANGTLQATGGTPAPLPAITTTTTNATFIAGATTGTVAVLSAPPAGATRTLLPGDGRLALNSTGTAIVVGLTASSAGTINATVQDKNASTGAVSPILTIPVTVTAAASAPAPAPAPAPTPTPTPAPTPVNGAVIQTFALSNWSSAAPSAGLARQGVAFAMGAVPAGSSIQVQRNGAAVAVQFDERSSYPDGSLHIAVMHLCDTPLAAGESRTYSHVLASGVPFANAGTATLAAITGTHDFKLTFDALTETNDAGATTPVGSGAFQGNFNAHMAVATRREKHHSGTVCEGWIGWGMATDTAGGAADAHLQVIWHGDLWKNTDGSTYAVEVAGEPAQHFWSVPNKRRRNYNAALRDGNTAIASYPGVVHPYNSRWLTCQNAGGNSRGKRHWIGGAQPTLTYKPDRAAWIAAGVVPSYDLTHARNPYPTGNNANYIPCGAADQRANVDGTGAYEGRGILPNQDVIAFCRQTPEDYAAARINAHCAMHLPMHHRSNNQRTRPGEAPDVANTPISLIMGRSGTGPALPGYNFTAQGMPAPVHAYADMRSDPAYQDGYTEPQGGSGVWAWSYQDDSRPTSRAGSAAHTVNHGFLMYLLEGERYHLEALLDQATNTVHERISNEAARPYMIWTYGQDPIWDAIAQISDQERSFGWAINVIGSAAGTVPDAHVAAGCIKRFNRQQALYLKDYLAGMPAYWEATGLSPWNSSNDIVHAPWMLAFQGLGCFQNWRLTGDLDIKAWAAHVAKWSRNQVRDRIYLTYLYRAAFRAVDGPYNAVTNPYRLLPLLVDQPVANIAAATGILTGSERRNNGDQVYVAARDYDSHPIAVPPELTQGVPYYVVNANVPAKTFQIATSPGGTPLSFAADRTNVHFFFDDVTADTTAAVTPGADSYPSIHTALVVDDYLAGAAGASLSLVSKALNFCSGNGNQVAGWATWDYAPPGGVPVAQTPAPTPTPTPTPTPASTSTPTGTPLTLTGATFGAAPAGFGQQLTGGSGTASIAVPAGSSTLEFWFTGPPVASGSFHVLVALKAPNNIDVSTVAIDGVGDFFIAGVSGNTSITGFALANNVRHHVAIVVDVAGGFVYAFFDGTPRTTRSITGATPAATVLEITAAGAGAGWGTIDEVRVSNNVRYTASFTLPTGPFSNDANTIALYHLDGNGAAG